MKKKVLHTFLICWLFTLPVMAQDSCMVVKAEPQLSDIYGALRSLNVHIFRFDISSFLKSVYQVNLYIDEYEKDSIPHRYRDVSLGTNIESLDNVPEEYREEFRKIKQVPEGKNEWDNIKDISIYLTKPNDSIASFEINIPNTLTTRQRVKLHPISEYNTYFYDVRPFTFKATEEKDTVSIPLLLYGSAWLDKKYNIIRFCGESEIDPDMKAELLKELPHYYIIGLKLTKEQNTLK